MESFKDANAFAEHIKTELYEYGAEPDDIELRQAALRDRYASEIAESGFAVNKDFSPINTAYKDAIAALVEQFYSTLPQQVRTNFESRFHFTTIDNRVLNASITRSGDGRFYGVFIFSALITVLHRLAKLELASLFPSEVDFCSRFPNQSVGRKQMVELYVEVYTYFTITKLPHGPLVLLKEPLNSQHLFKLTIQEFLIIFHELGHFLNEDLKPGFEEREVISPFPNPSYQREHMADVVGFGLLLRQFSLTGELTRDLRYLFLMCLIDLFKVQHHIQGIETAIYPHPLNRMSLVITKFYGAITEEWVADAILNENMKNLAIENFPEIESDEETILSYIEQQLLVAFED